MILCSFLDVLSVVFYDFYTNLTLFICRLFMRIKKNFFVSD